MNEKKNSQKILFLSYFYPPIGGQGLPGAQRSVKFIKYFKNFKIVVLTIKESACPSFYKLNYKRDLPVKNEIIYRIPTIDIFESIIGIRDRLKLFLGKKSSHSPSEITINNTQSNQENSNDNDRKSILGKLNDFIHDLCYFPDEASGWMIPAILYGSRIIKQENIDIIFATGMPWSSLVAAYFLNLLTGIPYLLDFRDPWVANPYQVSKGKLFDWLLKILEKNLIARASVVCANTENLKQDFLARYPNINKNKFITLPNGFDSEEFQTPRNADNITNDKDILVLAHAGLLYKQRDPVTIYRAIEELINENPDLAGKIKFLQIGDVQLSYDPKNEYAHLYKINMLENIESVDYHTCLNILASADVMLLIQPNTLTQVPSKLYDYLCLKKPIISIAPPKGELHSMITANGFGKIVAPEDVQGLKSMLLDLYNLKRDDCVLDVEYNNIKYFDVVNITNKFEEKIISVLNSK